MLNLCVIWLFIKKKIRKFFFVKKVVSVVLLENGENDGY